MNIQQAALLAHQTGTAMHRPPLGRRFCIVPTNTDRGCMLVHDTQNRATEFRWQPTLEDLTAEDWAVVDPAKGILHGRTAVDEVERFEPDQRPTTTMAVQDQAPVAAQEQQTTEASTETAQEQTTDTVQEQNQQVSAQGMQDPPQGTAAPEQVETTPKPAAKKGAKKANEGTA